MKAPWVGTWWGQALLVAAAVWLVGAGWFYLYDRNGDGVDDGGLDLSAHTTVARLVLPQVGALLVTELDRPVADHPAAFRLSPRSPPPHLLAS